MVSNKLSILRNNAAKTLAAKALMVAMTVPSPLAVAQDSRQMLNRAMIVPQIGKQLPIEATFLDHQGDAIALRELTGQRPTVLCLVYFECPMLCKLAADGLVRCAASIPEQVGDAYNIAFISFDPRDTPARADAARKQSLRQYARDETGKGWYFLTGKPSSIDAITQAVGFQYAWDEASGQYSHASGLIVISPDGLITEYLDGVRFSPQELSAAVERAAVGRSSASQSLSFARCYLYDPTTGKFGAAVQWTLRGLGLATIVAVGVMVYRLPGSKATGAQDAVAEKEEG